MRLRPATTEDAEALRKVFTAAVHELAAEHYDEAQRNAWAPRAHDPETWRARLEGLETRLVEDEDGPLGFLSFEWDGYVDLLFTDPRAARRGVATALHALAESELITRGIARLTTQSSLAARPFFESQGYVLDREEEIEIRGSRLRRFAMHKDLPPDTGPFEPLAVPSEPPGFS